MQSTLSLFGFFSLVWIVVGVLFVAKKYPGYNHKTQFLSELGAVGSPTQYLSPRINNFPLAILFCLFGVHLMGNTAGDVILMLIGICVVLHGVGTFMAGIFPMDSDPFTKQPSTSGKIHALSGMVMFISLLVAPVAGVFSSLFGVGFQIFSGACVAIVTLASYFMAKAFSNRGAVGLHQRLSYGVQLLWLSCLSWILFLRVV